MPEDRLLTLVQDDDGPPWRAIYDECKKRGDYERWKTRRSAIPVRDALGRMDPYEREYRRKERRKARGVKRTALGMETSGVFTNEQICWYVSSGWQSTSWSLDMDVFQKLMGDLYHSAQEARRNPS